MWVGLTESVEGLNRTKTDLPEPEEIAIKTAFGLKLHVFPGSPACWPTLQVFGSPSFHNRKSRFLKKKVYEVCVRIPVCEVPVCVNPVGSVSLENTE